MMAKLPAITPPIKGQIIQQVNFNFIYWLNKIPIGLKQYKLQKNNKTIKKIYCII